jgi:hypothetical protein
MLQVIPEQTHGAVFLTRIVVDVLSPMNDEGEFVQLDQVQVSCAAEPGT